MIIGRFHVRSVMLAPKTEGECMSAGVVFVKPMTCTECAKHIKELRRKKIAFLEERAKLMRCQGCEMLDALKPKGKG